MVVVLRLPASTATSHGSRGSRPLDYLPSHTSVRSPQTLLVRSRALVRAYLGALSPTLLTALSPPTHLKCLVASRASF